MEEAAGFHHNYFGSEHILLGLLREQEGVAAQVLRNCGLTLEDVRAQILSLLGRVIEESRNDTATNDQPTREAAQ